jgi:hypothetical protein
MRSKFKINNLNITGSQSNILPLRLISVLLVIGAAVSTLSCKKLDDTNNDPPNVYLNFETVQEPLGKIPTRTIDPNGSGNGCLNEWSWNSYYNHNVCIASTCDLSHFSIERSSKYSRKDGNSLRVYLQPTPLDKWPLGEATHRAELRPLRQNGFNPYPVEGEERWYGISYLFPKSFIFAPSAIEDQIHFCIAQWQHGSPGSSIMDLEVFGDEIWLIRHSGTSSSPKYLGGSKPLCKIIPDKWIDLIVQVRWSKQNGSIKIWANGDVAYAAKNIQTIYHDLNNGGGFKLGIYYWRWKDKENVRKTINAGIKNREIYIDEVREYIGSNGLSVVKPGS